MVVAIIAVVATLGSESVYAAAKSSKYATESMRTSASAPRASMGASSGVNRVSLGMTTIPAYPGATGAGLSALIELGEGNSLQGVFEIGYVQAFGVSAGAIFRHDIKTSGDSGFHVGGGLGMGVGGAGMGGYNFGLLATGVGGFHVAVPGTSGNLVAHFDAALGIGFTAGASPAAFYTNLGALSSALGLSLHYAI